VAERLIVGPVVERLIVGPVVERLIVAHMAMWRCAALMADIASANAITEAFGTAPDGATGAAGGGHMA
jgi:hypothetical protein